MSGLMNTVPLLGIGERLPMAMQGQIDDSYAREEDALKAAAIAHQEASDIDDEDDDGSKGPQHLFGTDFDENLADAGRLAESELNAIAAELLRGIDSDKAARSTWENTAMKAVDLLGLELSDPSASVTGGGAGASVSHTKHPLMQEACIQFWASAQAELLPSAGPVKVRDDSPEPVTRVPGMGDNGGPKLEDEEPTDPDATTRSELAEALEKDMNHYLTVTDRGYYADFARMLYSLGAMGTEFRKVYRDPIRGRPTSEWVKGFNLIVSSDATSTENASRVTERIPYRTSQVKRLQLAKWWRDIDLVRPAYIENQVADKIAQSQGIDNAPQQPEDMPHEIYECYTELDLAGYRHQKVDEDGEIDGDFTGLPLPYRVTIDRDSQQILEIRRNWKHDDHLMLPRQRYVMYGLIPGLGFYYSGFVHIIGNSTRALTAILNQLLDAGQFANFPGFLIAKGMSRQVSTQIAISPGEGKEIDTGGKPLRDAVMPMPYQGPSQVLAAVADSHAQDARKVVGTSQVPIGEGRADIPVGTALAGIEQALKPMAAIHKGLHASQAVEFELLRELFIEDPGALWRYNKKPARKWEQAEELADLDIVPASDPNIPSQMHRIMQTAALVQLATGAPGVFDPKWVAKRAMRVLGIPFDSSAFAQQQAQPQMPPQQQVKMAELQQKQAENQRKAAAEAAQTQERAQQSQQAAQLEAAQLASRERIAQTSEQTERLRLQVEEERARRQENDARSKVAMDHRVAMQPKPGIGPVAKPQEPVLP